MILLLALMVLWVPDWCSDGRSNSPEKSCYENKKALTKAMKNTTDLTSQLLKTVTVNVLESKYDCKVSYEMVNVVEDSGEGRFFLLPAGARKR